MRASFILVALILLAVCFPFESLACDCIDLSPTESFAKADFVFIGEAIRQQESGSDTIFTFRVRNSLKGATSEETSITSYNTDCDSAFSVGSVYRVYATRTDDGRLISPSCTATSAIGVAAKLSESDSTNTRLTPSVLRTGAAILGAGLLLCFLIWFLPGRFRQRTE